MPHDSLVALLDRLEKGPGADAVGRGERNLPILSHVPVCSPAGYGAKGSIPNADHQPNTEPLTWFNDLQLDLLASLVHWDVGSHDHVFGRMIRRHGALPVSLARMIDAADDGTAA